MENAYLELKNINKIYPGGNQAVYNFSLQANKNEFVVFVGPSGCGKTTTLRMIAGLEDISSGELYINGKLSNFIEVQKRNIAMVFQNYALYPQLNVFDNIAYSLKIKHLPKEEIKQKVFEAAKILGLGPYLDRYPRELSGGQMQRVALGRAIVKDSDLFLLDEPLSNLDAKLRVQMRQEIVKIHKRIGATTVYVTHDQIEAMTMADKIVVMNKGYIQQIDSPKNIYSNPKNLFVASFIGTPPMNIFDASYDGEQIVAGDLHIKISNKNKTMIKEFYENKSTIYENLYKIATSKLLDPIYTNLNKISAKKKKNIKLIETTLKPLLEINNLNDLDKDLRDNLTNLYKLFEINDIENFNVQTQVLIEKCIKLKNEFDNEINKIKSSQLYLKEEKMEVDTKKKKIPFWKKNNVVKKENTINNKDLFIEFFENFKHKDKEIKIGIRPEKISVNKGEILLYKDKLDSVELLGNELYLYFEIQEKNLIAKILTDKLYQSGQNIELYVNEEDLNFFDSYSGENIGYKAL